MSCNCSGEHNHQHSDGGKCNSNDKEHTDFIHLTLEDGKELKCEVVSIFEIENNNYIALLPEAAETVFIYKYEETEEGPELSTIEDNNEYDKVSEMYNKKLKAENEDKQ